MDVGAEVGAEVVVLGMILNSPPDVVPGMVAEGPAYGGALNVRHSVGWGDQPFHSYRLVDWD